MESGMRPGALGLLEIKSGQTFSSDWLTPLRRVAAILGETTQRQMLVYGGEDHYIREGIEVVELPAKAR